jgi:hypothetical protein
MSAARRRRESKQRYCANFKRRDLQDRGEGFMGTLPPLALRLRFFSR